MESPLKYKTITGTATGDFRDRGSKFLSFAFPVTTTDEVKKQLQVLRKEHPKANHHCYAFRLGTDGNSFRAVDDGEPAGSAGKPILGQIDSAGITDVLIAVVRYFGGTLLGIPGLAHAYKTAAGAALSDIVLVEKWIENRVTISFDYPAMGEVLHILKQHEAIIYSQDLQLFCNITAGIPKPQSESCLQKLSEIRNLKWETNR